MYKPFGLPNDWDYLIILDACRYDFFVKYWDLSPVEPRISLDSCTLGVLEKFPRIPSSVVFTGHPFVLTYGNCFERRVDVGFDWSLGTTPPDYVVGKFLALRWLFRRYRRKVLWFLQPHHPYIGETKLLIPVMDRRYEGGMPPQEEIERRMWEAKRKGVLERAYEDNLKLVLKYVKTLVKMLKGKIIITSDHAEGLAKPLREGDEPVMSHPCGRGELEVRLIPYTVIITKR